jgi:hypothetical protein
MSDRPTPETDEAWDKYINFPYTNGAGDLRILAQRLERERDEARAVAASMADIAFKRLTSLLASTPHSSDAAHDEETQEVIQAIKRWKEMKK